jgi:DNA invertase Pin-like site-specific DNA recombinase
MCRLARSLRDLLEIVETLISRGVTIRFHSEGLTFTSIENPFATMQMQILASVAQFERTISKRRQSEGIAIAKSKGTKSGKPFGNQPLDMTRRNEAIDHSKSGLNISQIAKAMKLSRGSIYKLLS